MSDNKVRPAILIQAQPGSHVVGNIENVNVTIEHDGRFVMQKPEQQTEVQDAEELDLAAMSFSYFDWINQNYTKEQKWKEVKDIRNELLAECNSREKIIGKKLEIMGDVLRPRFLRHVINGMPKYAVAKKLFGDLPCLMNERNYAQLVDYVTTGHYDKIKG